MSGVIVKGKQYEHCNGCGGYVLLDKLWYEKPSAEHEHGRDLCRICAIRSPYAVERPR